MQKIRRAVRRFPGTVVQRAPSATAAKPFKGLGINGWLAAWYARLTRPSLADLANLAASIAATLPSGARVLEVAPGPGYLATELARLGLSVEAVDISASFVQIASANARAAGVAVAFRQGDVHALPYPDGCFDFLVCRAAFKNFSRPNIALQEMHRVLHHGAHAMIVDMRRDVTDNDIDQWVANGVPGWFNVMLVGWTFELMLRRRAYLAEEFHRLAFNAGFTACDMTQDVLSFTARLRR